MYARLWYRTFAALFAIMIGATCGLARGGGAESPLLTLVKRTQSAQKDVGIGSIGGALDLPAYEYPELTITNTSGVLMELPYNMHICQYFTPTVRRESGELVSSGRNLGRTLSVLTPGRLTIGSGESQKIRLDMWSESVPTEKLTPGTYHVRVQFQYGGRLWESNEIEIRYK